MLQRADLTRKWVTMEPRLATATYYRLVGPGDADFLPVALTHLGIRNPTWKDEGTDPRLSAVDIVLSLWADDAGGITWQPLHDDWVHLHEAGDLSDTRWIVAQGGVLRKVFGSHWHLMCVKKRG